VIVHAGEFCDGVASRQFSFDRRLYPLQNREDSCDGEACERTPPLLAPWRRVADAMYLVKRSSRMQFHDAFSLTLFEAEALLAGDVARKSSRLRGAAKWRVV